MTHCHVPPEPSVRAKARNKRSLFYSIGRCVRVEERQQPHTTYTIRTLCRAALSGTLRKRAQKCKSPPRECLDVENNLRITTRSDLITSRCGGEYGARREGERRSLSWPRGYRRILQRTLFREEM
ncbi:hypothetical protein EVAR_75644_1 [Eumeta japonica]|uniref:Uncharacterized protein n=1 Tax=Eumeta variegata TaxID=151549 RepID=A0A4C1U028_EUMVA|nr:hypothetical protein EVAR_75644_1 [Eumeta japonica]